MMVIFTSNLNLSRYTRKCKNGYINLDSKQLKEYDE
jgi:hypothetical protein